MFLAIQVEFGPHEADWWMVGVTAASVLVSLAVAIVAIWNGRTASRIANEAADREQTHRRLEAERQTAQERAVVATNLLEALEAFVVWTETGPVVGRDSTTAASAEFRRRKIDAWSKLANYPSDDAERMRVWLDCQLGEINKLAKKRDDRMAEIYEVAKEVRKRLAEWNRSEWSPPN